MDQKEKASPVGVVLGRLSVPRLRTALQPSYGGQACNSCSGLWEQLRDDEGCRLLRFVVDH
jgi:hypothetical protein